MLIVKILNLSLNLVVNNFQLVDTNVTVSSWRLKIGLLQTCPAKYSVMYWTTVGFNLMIV
jgi:hypothetical protein